MIKLKDILKESYVWERKFGEKLPSLADVQKKKNEGKLTEGKIKLSGDSVMHFGSGKAVIKTKEGTAILTKKELQNLAKGLKKYRLGEGELTEAKETIFDVAARVVKNHSAEKWKGSLMDATSANLLVKVFKKVNPKMKQILSKLGEDNPAGLMKTLWAVVK